MVKISLVDCDLVELFSYYSEFVPRSGDMLTFEPSDDQRDILEKKHGVTIPSWVMGTTSNALVNLEHNFDNDGTIFFNESEEDNYEYWSKSERTECVSIMLSDLHFGE